MRPTRAGAENWLGSFTDSAERERFEEPLRVFYLQRENARRVLDDFSKAKQAYAQMAESALEEREALKPAQEAMERIVEERLDGYQQRASRRRSRASRSVARASRRRSGSSTAAS